MKRILGGALLLVTIAWSGNALGQGPGMDLERRAEQRFEEDDLDTAILLYRQAAARQENLGEQVRLLITTAWVEHLSSEDSAALATLTEALTLTPEYLFRGELYDDSFRNLFYEAQKRALEERGYQASLRIHEARKLVAQQDYAQARRLLADALKLETDHPQALFNLALIDLQEQRLEEATSGFEKVVALHNNRPTELSASLAAPALTNLGLLYNSRNLHEEAEALLLQAVEIDDQQSFAWTNLGISRRNLGKGREAAAAFRRAYALNPEDPNVLNNLSLAYTDNQDWVAAVGLLVGATERFPESANLWLNLGLAQRGMGNRSGSLASFAKVLTLDPNNDQGLAAVAAARRSRYYYEEKDHTRCLADAQRVIGWRPESTEGWVYQGLAQRSLGDLNGARISLEEAARLNPLGAEIHNNLGSVYLSLEQFQKAQAAFERALEINPSLQGARENLATLAQVRGHRPGNRPTPRPRVVASKPPPPRVAPPPTAAPPRAPASASTTPTSSPAPANREHGLVFAKIDYAAMGLKGTLVESVAPGSPAEKAGIQAEDLIVKVDQQDVENGEKLDRYLRQQRDRAAFNLVILRNNLPRQFILRLR